MCGIVGFVTAEPLDPQREASRLQRMVAALRHRGPDDHGQLILSHAALGHTRLSIIDLSPSGRQPMANEDGTIHITYNGEIYNYRELREQLIGQGHQFASQSDTEVLIHGYEQWGIDELIERVEGMYAFGLWDDKRQHLYLARDHIGIKPLYWVRRADRLIFASEVKALIAYDGTSPPMREDALLLSLHHIGVPAPATMYEGYAQLPPGTYLCFDRVAGTVTERRHWSWQIDPTIHDPEEAERQLWDVICRSVEKHLIADVPVGIFLSGGLDSSLVAAACAEIGHKVTCLTIAIDDERHDESPFAQAVCRRYGLEHQVYPMDAEAGRAYEDKLGTIFDEPFASSAALSTAHIAKIASERFKVMLSGEGGDELFGGYKWYRQWLDHYGHDGNNQSVLSRATSVLRRVFGRRHLPSDPLEGFARLIGCFPPEVIVRLFDRDLLSRCFSASDAASRYRRLDVPELAGFDRLQSLDMRLFLPVVCLRKMDRTSMHHGLEVRVPLLDKTVATVAASIPQQVRNPDGQLKGLIKRIARKKLPIELIDKPKQGFSTPINRWFAYQQMLATMSRDQAEGDWWRGIFAPEAPAALKHLRGRTLWRIYQLWRWVSIART